MKNKILLFGIVLLTAGATLAGNAVPAYPNFHLPRVEVMMFLVWQIGIIFFSASL